MAIDSVVVLPAPLGPTRPKKQPRGTSRSIPATAATCPNDLLSPRTCTAGTSGVTGRPYGLGVQVTWCSERHRPSLVDLVQAVAVTGGAVGWLTVPPAEEALAWLDGLLASGARLAVCTDGRTVLACGAWRRYDGVVLHALAQVTKVMTHPDARGRGAARAVMELLVQDAREAAVEVLTLDVRGNNHGALRLYAGLGFVVTGRRPDVLSVERERFDQVLMHLDLRFGPAGLIRHGGRREGPGAT